MLISGGLQVTPGVAPGLNLIKFYLFIFFSVFPGYRVKYRIS